MLALPYKLHLILYKQAVCDVREYITQHESPENLHVDPLDPTVDHSLEPVGGYPHKSAIQCMYALPGLVEEKLSTAECLDGYQSSSRYLTGDKDGNVCIWRMVRTVAGKNLRLVLMKTFNVMQLKPVPLGASVRSVCLRDGMILLGLQSSEILEVIEGSFPFLISRHRTTDTPFNGTLRLPMSGRSDIFKDRNILLGTRVATMVYHCCLPTVCLYKLQTKK